MKAYLAGPDVFLPDAAAHFVRKAAICRALGITPLPPLDPEIERCARAGDWRGIFARDLALMQQADCAIANLSPFRGPSADAGTLVEIGWFLGAGRPVFAYSNTATPFDRRTEAHRIIQPDPIAGIAPETFGLVDNLMVPGTVEAAGGLPVLTPETDQPFDSLATFERCCAAAVRAMRARPLG